MALTSGAFPYDIENLLGGAVRILYAPLSTAVPSGIHSVISMVSPYTAQTGWTDLGATKESFTYTRGFATQGWEIQQQAGNVVEEITDITRSIALSIADLHAERLKMIENAPNVSTIAAASGRGAQKKIPFGSFASLQRYRWAFISRRSIQSGIVTEPGGATRGRFFMGCAYTSQISADDVSLEQGKGDLTAAGVTWTLFPDGTQADGEEYGAWFPEEAGAIPA